MLMCTAGNDKRIQSIRPPLILDRRLVVAQMKTYVTEGAWRERAGEIVAQADLPLFPAFPWEIRKFRFIEFSAKLSRK